MDILKSVGETAEKASEQRQLVSRVAGEAVIFEQVAICYRRHNKGKVSWVGVALHLFQELS